MDRILLCTAMLSSLIGCLSSNLSGGFLAAIFTRVLRNSLRIASPCGSNNIAEQKDDLYFLDSYFNKVLGAIKVDMRFLVGEAMVQEGKIVGWVTKLAAPFLPVPLLVTILSISDPGYIR